MKYRKLSLYLPDGLDPKEIPGNGERPARIAYFGQQLTIRPFDCLSKHVPINATSLRKDISKRAVIEALKYFGPMIETNQSYKVGKHPKGYRWGQSMRGKKAVKHDFICPRFIEKLNSNKASGKAHYGSIERQLDEDMHNISLDIPNIADYINQIPPKLGTRCETHRRNVLQYTAECIQCSDYGLILRSNTNGRIYCCINRLSSYIRPGLLLYGEPVVEIDLASSQPYFLASIFKCLPLIDAVSKGQFYNRINERLKPPLNFTNISTYKSFKRIILSIIFAHNKYGYRYWTKAEFKHAQVREAMGKAYPGILEFIEQYRRRNGPTALAIDMQSAESSVFIDRVLATLQSQGIPSIPIHDSIMCRLSDVDHVQELMHMHLTKETSIRPTLCRSVSA